MMNISETALLTVIRAGGEIPDPGSPSAPPGFEGFTDIMSWAKWLALGVLILCLMAAGVRLAMGGRHGGGEEHAGRIGSVLIGVIIVSAAGSLVGFLAS